MEHHIEIRVRTAAIWDANGSNMGCIHVTKATRGVITSETHSRREAQTRLLCVFNTLLEIYVELHCT